MNIKDKLVYAASKWRLTNLTKIYENALRAVYRANSEDWGGVIVKINSNVGELRHEAAMLKALCGNGCCRLYAYEKEQGILVEELISPGTVLREEKDLHRRVEVFAAVFEKLHGCAEEVYDMPKPGMQKSYMDETGALESERYTDWLANAKRFCEEGMRSDSVKVQTILKESGLLEKMQHAYEIGAELFARYPKRVLLHGDLHHDNILQNAEGGYSVIDPKGVMGPEIFDVPRFVLNEFGYVEEKGTEEIKAHLERVMQLIAARLNFSLEDIRKLFYMETVLASVWCVEDGEEVDAGMMEAVTIMLRESSTFE